MTKPTAILAPIFLGTSPLTYNGMSVPLWRLRHAYLPPVAFYSACVL
jgi:hypothetical protein